MPISSRPEDCDLRAIESSRIGVDALQSRVWRDRVLSGRKAGSALIVVACLTGVSGATRPVSAATGLAAPGLSAGSSAGSDRIDEALEGLRGDPARGRAIVADRTRGLCLLCHSGPFPEERQQGNLAPDLAGAGSRWSTAQLRARIVDSRRVNPQSIMPAYHRTEGLERVAPAFRDRPILDAQQVEDVVAYLTTLRNEPGETKR
jgi:sulfur-oxidizing protein SoxX